MPIANVHGVPLHYEVVGQGPAVLLIPGFDLAGWSWYRQMRALSREFTTIVLEHRGFDGSVPLPQGFGIADMADDARAVLAHLGVARACVVGFSLGGFVAQNLALRHPDVVASLVLVSTTAGPRGAVSAAPGVLESMMSATRPAGDTGARAGARAQADRFSFSDACLAEPPDFLRAFFEQRDRQPSSGDNWLRFVGVAMGHDAAHKLGALECPCLVVAGADDPVIPVANARHLVSLIPGAQLHIVAGGRHLCFIEYADEFNRVVTEFVRAPRNP